MHKVRLPGVMLPFDADSGSAVECTGDSYTRETKGKVCGIYELWPFIYAVTSVFLMYCGSISMIVIGTIWLYSDTTVCGITLSTAAFSMKTTVGHRLLSGNSCPGYNWYSEKNPNKAGVHMFSVSLPTSPQLSSIPLGVGMRSTGEAVLVPIGYSLNGIAIYSNADTLKRDAVESEGASFDRCAGHVSPGKFLSTGVYHYHQMPGDQNPMDHRTNTGNLKYCPDVSTWYKDTENVHSPLVGFMADGIPIYGPRGGLPVDVPSDLDRCGGHSGDGIDFYHYHFTTTYPYSVECLHGCVSSDWHSSLSPNQCLTNNMPQYDYSALAGYNVMYGGAGENAKVPNNITSLQYNMRHLIISLQYRLTQGTLGWTHTSYCLWCYIYHSVATGVVPVLPQSKVGCDRYRSPEHHEEVDEARGDFRFKGW